MLRALPNPDPQLFFNLVRVSMRMDKDLRVAVSQDAWDDFFWGDLKWPEGMRMGPQLNRWLDKKQRAQATELLIALRPKFAKKPDAAQFICYATVASRCRRLKVVRKLVAGEPYWFILCQDEAIAPDAQWSLVR